MKTIIDYCNYMLVVLVVLYFITVNVKYRAIFVYDDFSSKKNAKLYVADTSLERRLFSGTIVFRYREF